jgi:hypothetical protein
LRADETDETKDKHSVRVPPRFFAAQRTLAQNDNPNFHSGP